MTVTRAPDPSPPPPTAVPTRDDLLRQHVLAKIVPLQHQYLDGSPTAAASLAKLRRAVNTSPGSEPAIWFDTLADVPPRLIGTGDTPSTYEMAIHASVTLYATHQQSQRTRMHQYTYPLGRSVRLLAKRISNETMKNDNPVLRRFHALGTASSLPETLHHLRGLITQLRGEEIALDYGQLATDLRRLQDPHRAAGVRLQWGRDYHRITSDPTTATVSESSDSPSAGSPDSSATDSMMGAPE